MKKQIEVKKEQPLIAVVRTQEDSLIFKVASLQELADKIESIPNLDPCKVTIFKDRDRIGLEAAELSHRIEALSVFMNPEGEASNLNRTVGTFLLTDMVTDMRGLIMASV